MLDKNYYLAIFAIATIFEKSLMVDIVIFTHLPQTPEAIANHYFSVYL